MNDVPAPTDEVTTEAPERIWICTDGHSPQIATWTKDFRPCDIEYVRVDLVRADSRPSAPAPVCKCGHSKSEHWFLSDHDECNECFTEGRDEPCTEFVAAPETRDLGDGWYQRGDLVSRCDGNSVTTLNLGDFRPGAPAERRRATFDVGFAQERRRVNVGPPAALSAPAPDAELLRLLDEVDAWVGRGLPPSMGAKFWLTRLSRELRARLAAPQQDQEKERE